MVEFTIPLVLQIIQTVSLVIGIIYYLTIMGNSQRNQQLQLETRQAQLFLQLYNRYRDDTRDLDIAKSFLEVEIESFNDLIRLLETDKDFHRTFAVLGGDSTRVLVLW